MDLARTYRIETDRLIIRCYEPADAAKLLEAVKISLDHLLPWMPWARQEPESLETKINRVRLARGQFDLGQDYTFGIFNKTDNELIGSAGLHTRGCVQMREIGYWISVTHINKGYASEAVSALTKTGFEVEGLARIEIHCTPENIRSRRIPEKLGYRLERTLKHNVQDVNGNPRDTMIWVMLREDYEQSPARDHHLKAFDIVGREILLRQTIKI